jgi:hypothetical protein
MTRGHKTILLLVLWVGIVLACLTMLVFEQGGRWILYSVFALAAGLGVVCLGIMAVPVPKTYPVGFCEQCGYDLTGNQSGRCSECGAVAARPTAASSADPALEQHARTP